MEIQGCRVCAPFLADGCRPVVAAHPESRIALIGQAPGRKVHESGIPWDDQSGANLRSWMQIDKDAFYDPRLIAIVPMGFCFPGTGKSGDLPPRKECAPLWHERLFQLMPQIELTLLVGQYAQAAYLGKRKERTLTETVRNFNNYLPELLPLPHPSPRNNIWMRKNPWFQEEVIPVLRNRISSMLHL